MTTARARYAAHLCPKCGAGRSTDIERDQEEWTCGSFPFVGAMAGMPEVIHQSDKCRIAELEQQLAHTIARDAVAAPVVQQLNCPHTNWNAKGAHCSDCGITDYEIQCGQTRPAPTQPTVVQQGLESCVTELAAFAEASKVVYSQSEGEDAEYCAGKMNAYRESIEIVTKHWPAPASPSEATELADKLDKMAVFLADGTEGATLDQAAAMLRRLVAENETRWKMIVGQAEEIRDLKAERERLRSSYAALVERLQALANSWVDDYGHAYEAAYVTTCANSLLSALAEPQAATGKTKLDALEEVCMDWLAMLAMADLPEDMQELRLRMSSILSDEPQAATEPSESDKRDWEECDRADKSRKEKP